ncbi:MAG TPA: hypothetical protein VD996_04570, partial [Chitinophagaceae bacterium]|nr:hypothetical protein [Chitinophagaceae bacterium]
SFFGKVEQHTTSSYTELSVNENNVLTLVYAPNRRNATVLRADQWSINEIKDRSYLCFGSKQEYEIITLERDDMVLSDPAKGEKLFFVRLSQWTSRVEQAAIAVKQPAKGVAHKK